jgi:hypothetical protein
LEASAGRCREIPKARPIRPGANRLELKKPLRAAPAKPDHGLAIDPS